jgi:uncharacterized membrane protein YeaQ/YmgE (transglycosylase-associated protein family)
MTLAMLTTSILVGLLTGWLAGFVMPKGCHGRLADLSLGVGGSSVASLLFGALGVAPDAGQLVTVAAGVSFVGAAIVIGAQRKAWHARA